LVGRLLNGQCEHYTMTLPTITAPLIVAGVLLWLNVLLPEPVAAGAA
jgi:hypothetical protein